jgi:hypothetical protein
MSLLGKSALVLDSRSELPPAPTSMDSDATSTMSRSISFKGITERRASRSSEPYEMPTIASPPRRTPK